MDAIDENDPVYFYKPNLMGSPWIFRLADKGLVWEYGRRSGFVRYDRVERVRMSFKPGTLQNYRFFCEIWSPENPKLSISSATFRGLMEQARQDDEYVAFVAELHRRLAAAGSGATFQTGMHPAMYWVGVALFGAIGVGLAGFFIRTLFSGDWTGAALIAGVIMLVVWQAGTMFYRNRPGFYRPDALPHAALPRVSRKAG